LRIKATCEIYLLIFLTEHVKFSSTLFSYLTKKVKRKKSLIWLACEVQLFPLFFILNPRNKEGKKKVRGQSSCLTQFAIENNILH
jgi:hypothetical protein